MSGRTPARANIILCANCGIALKPGTARTVPNLPEEVKFMLQEWIDRKVLETDRICKNCDHALNQSVEDKDTKRKVPHSKLCAGCGKSVLRERYKTYKPDNPVAIAVLAWHPQLRPKEEVIVCHACNRHLDRKISKQSKESQKAKEFSENKHQKIKNETANGDQFATRNEMKCEEGNDRASRLNKRHEMLIQQECLTEAPGEESKNLQPEKLILPNYKRLPNTARRCIFRNCTQDNRSMVPKYLKETLLIDYKIYTGNKARICSYHIKNGDWKMLLENKLLNDFSATDVEDALEILQKPRENPVEFDDVEGMPNSLCQFLTGMTKNDFISLHESVTWNFSHSRKALAVLLMKVRSKDPFEKIASLMGLSRETTQRYFNLATESLEKADCQRLKVVNIPVEINGSGEQNCKSDDEELLSDGEQ